MTLQEKINHIFSNPFVIGDTETTGGGMEDEIIDISFITTRGAVLFDSLLRPSKKINPRAQDIHGISDWDLYNAPHIMLVHKYIDFILANNRLITFNISFDTRLIRQTYYRYKISYPNMEDPLCLMNLYSEFAGKKKSLEDACKDMGLEPGEHRALSDSRAKLRLLYKMREVLCQEASKSRSSSQFTPKGMETNF